MGRIILGLGLIALGIAMVLKSENFYQTFGTIRWAEEHLSGSGGSRVFYKLAGVGVAIIGILIATDLFNAFLEATVGALLIPG